MNRLHCREFETRLPIPWARLCKSFFMAASKTKKAQLRGTVLSIGYEGRELDDFISTLNIHRVDVLVDVRLNPISRKKGFSKTALASALAEVGIEYVHRPQLGNPKENREGFSGHGLATARRRYLAHLNNGSRPIYEEVIEQSRSRRIALLCVERDDRRCHRGCITDQAQDENPGLSVSRL